jgi:hypothetical protein
MKIYKERIAPTKNDKVLIQQIIEKTSGMYYLKIREPFDKEFADMFATNNTDGIIEYLQNKELKIENIDQFRRVLQIIYQIRRKYNERWLKYSKH